MSTSIKNTEYIVNINNANVDIANLTTAWAADFPDVNRQLVPVQNTTRTYYFPTIGTGFNSTINGQIITIYNKTGNTITINTGTAQVYYNNNNYGSNTTFNISNNRVVMFVLVYGQYYVQVYLANT